MFATSQPLITIVLALASAHPHLDGAPIVASAVSTDQGSALQAAKPPAAKATSSRHHAPNVTQHAAVQSARCTKPRYSLCQIIDSTNYTAAKESRNNQIPAELHLIRSYVGKINPNTLANNWVELMRPHSVTLAQSVSISSTGFIAKPGPHSRILRPWRSCVDWGLNRSATARPNSGNSSSAKFVSTANGCESRASSPNKVCSREADVWAVVL